MLKNDSDLTKLSTTSHTTAYHINNCIKRSDVRYVVVAITGHSFFTAFV